jgi:putative ABC transport system permease protein
MVFEPVAPQFEAQAMQQFRDAVANRQHFSAKDKRAITMFGRQEFKPIYDGITLGIEGLLFLIGSMTLAIGGVGVMNIMLVSVTERTREIGLRKAIGAKSKDITWQFLLEAMTLTGMGGLIALILVFMLVLLIRLTLRWPGVVPFWAAATGILVSVTIGLVFGVWPAMKAAKLDPVEALRYE